MLLYALSYYMSAFGDAVRPVWYNETSSAGRKGGTSGPAFRSEGEARLGCDAYLISKGFQP